MEKRPLLVTCGLPYTNGPCHIGHLRTYVPADFYVRFLRRAGEDVVFVCGSDNHGTPIVVMAEEQGVTPADLSRRYHAHFDGIFRRMGVLFDHFGMTDGETNHRRTRSLVRALQEHGYVYTQVIQQSYCPVCQRSLPDRYVEGLCPHCGALARGDECDQGCGKHLEPGEIRKPKCRICGTEAELREQEHYFFRLSAFRDFLMSYLPDLAGTSNARNYALGWVKDELHDWCITRTLEWGVRFPGKEDLVVYVWVDAPIGYISFTEEWAAKTGGDWQRFWCRDGGIIHFIGSDIIYHHCIFWPALLSGAGYHPPSAVVASGMVKIDDQKFSKSRGYVVWTGEDYLDRGLDPDYLRYYLLAYTSHTKELNFSWQGFAERVNNELVSTLGNFMYRSLYFAKQFFGTVPEGPVDPEVLDRIRQALEEVEKAVRDYEFKGAVDGIMALAAYGNTYIQNQAPWKLVKTDREAAAGVIRNCLQVVHALTLLMEPVMPGAADRAWRMLGHADPVAAHGIREGLEPAGTGPLPDPAPLFAKMEPDQVKVLDDVLKKRVKEAKMREQERTGISIEEFSRLDIRTAKVLSAEPVKGAKKLVKLQVDIGDGTRQVIAGIAEFHPVETLVGKDIVVVVNLKPAKIFGLESQAMLLAAGDRASLLTPLQPVPPGTKIK